MGFICIKKQNLRARPLGGIGVGLPAARGDPGDVPAGRTPAPVLVAPRRTIRLRAGRVSGTRGGLCSGIGRAHSGDTEVSPPQHMRRTCVPLALLVPRMRWTSVRRPCGWRTCAQQQPDTAQRRGAEEGLAPWLPPSCCPGRGARSGGSGAPRFLGQPQSGSKRSRDCGTGSPFLGYSAHHGGPPRRRVPFPPPPLRTDSDTWR